MERRTRRPTTHKELPPGTKVYDTLILRDKKKNGPKKGKAKVRVCVKKGPENVESHSPTVQMPTLHALLALLAAKKAKGAAGDFPQAYLNADQEIYYVWPPKTARQYDEQGMTRCDALRGHARTRGHSLESRGPGRGCPRPARCAGLHHGGGVRVDRVG